MQAAAHLLDDGVGLHVVPMGMAAKNDLDVRHLEPELLDGLFEQRDCFLEVRIDQNVAFGRREQIRVQRAGAHVMEVADDLVCGKCHPVLRAVLGGLCCDSSAERHRDACGDDGSHTRKSRHALTPDDEGRLHDRGGNSSTCYIRRSPDLWLVRCDRRTFISPRTGSCECDSRTNANAFAPRFEPLSESESGGGTHDAVDRRRGQAGAWVLSRTGKPPAPTPQCRCPNCELGPRIRALDFRPRLTCGE
jgi:hypothetical protein